MFKNGLLKRVGMSLEQEVQRIGREILRESANHRPGFLSEDWQREQLFAQADKNKDFKAQILRLLDVMPVLDEEGLVVHAREYLVDSGVELGFIKSAGLRLAGGNLSTYIRKVTDLMAKG